MATELIKGTLQKIKQAQGAWAQGVVEIGKADEFAVRANKMLDDLYDFDKGGFILFKPTLASVVPVRTTRAQASSYFIGGEIAEDKSGFARTPWKVVKFEDNFYFTVLESGDILSMGRCTFYASADQQGDAATADYTFGYRKDSMKIFLHHSSLKVEKDVQNRCKEKENI